MNALKDGDRKLVLAALGTLAIFGSIVMGAVFFAILQGLGMNEDLAWGLSVLMWLAVVLLGVLGVVYFFDSLKKRVEQVLQPVMAPPVTPEEPKVEVESQTHLDRPTLPTAPSSSYRSMLLEGDKKDDQPE